MKHEWFELGGRLAYPFRRLRKCSNCKAIQKHTTYSWEPKVGRCQPERPENEAPGRELLEQTKPVPRSLELPTLAEPDQWKTKGEKNTIRSARSLLNRIKSEHPGTYRIRLVKDGHSGYPLFRVEQKRRLVWYWRFEEVIKGPYKSLKSAERSCLSAVGRRPGEARQHGWRLYAEEKE
jgi:hypothetical protein